MEADFSEVLTIAVGALITIVVGFWGVLFRWYFDRRLKFEESRYERDIYIRDERKGIYDAIMAPYLVLFTPLIAFVNDKRFSKYSKKVVDKYGGLGEVSSALMGQSDTSVDVALLKEELKSCVEAAFGDLVYSFDYVKAASDLTLVASDGVVRALNDIMQHFYSVSSSSNSKEGLRLFKLYCRFALEVRKSIGVEDTGLTYDEMLEWKITDKHNYDW